MAHLLCAAIMPSASLGTGEENDKCRQDVGVSHGGIYLT